MMKKVITIILALMSIVTVQAGLLPTSSHYEGQTDRSFDLGSNGIANIHLDFAVYADQEAQTMMDMTGYTGDLLGAEQAFVYAYQFTCEDPTTAELTYFALTGINPGSIASDTDIRQVDSMTAPNGTDFESEGVASEPEDGFYSLEKTKAIWKYESGTMVQGDSSYFLFLYSADDWIVGDIEVLVDSSDIPVPGVPEPATMVLLSGGGVVLLLGRKYKGTC